MSKRKINKGKRKFLKEVTGRGGNYSSIPNVLPLLLTGNQLKVFSYLILIADDDNPPQTEIAPYTGLTTNTVNKVLKELIKLGIISRHDIGARYPIFKIEPMENWNFQQTVKDRMELILKQREKNCKLWFCTEKFSSLDKLIPKEICDIFFDSNYEENCNYSARKCEEKYDLERRKKATPKSITSRDNTSNSNRENSDLVESENSTYKEGSTMNDIEEHTSSEDYEDKIQLMMKEKMRLKERYMDRGHTEEEAEEMADAKIFEDRLDEVS